MPLISKAFGDIITFTRASTATYFDSAGVLQSAAIDTPRLDFNPSTLAAQGLLIEEQRTNSLTYSEDFSNAAWIKGNVTVLSDVVIAPDGTTTADKIVEDVANAQHHVRQGTTVSSGATVTVSVYAKAAERTTLQMYMNDNSTSANRVQANFDLSSGTTSAASNFGTFTGATSSITNVSNGWYRCVLTGVATGVTSVAERVAIGTTSYTGDGTSGIYIWGAQLEAGAFPTSYIPTTTTDLTRSADVASVNTLSPWYNATEGTIYVQYSERAFSQTHPLTYFSSGSATERINISVNSSNILDAQIVSGGTDTFSGNAPLLTEANYKVALAYASNNAGISVNGSSVTPDTGVVLPVSISLLNIGSTITPSQFLNSAIQRITYYPRRLSDAELQTITA